MQTRKLGTLLIGSALAGCAARAAPLAEPMVEKQREQPAETKNREPVVYSAWVHVYYCGAGEHPHREGCDEVFSNNGERIGQSLLPQELLSGAPKFQDCIDTKDGKKFLRIEGRMEKESDVLVSRPAGGRWATSLERRDEPAGEFRYMGRCEGASKGIVVQQ